MHAGNATRLDWDEACPNNGEDEIYLIGNPPYVGSSMQTTEQKADYPVVFGSSKYPKKLDYISLWFIKGAATSLAPVPSWPLFLPTPLPRANTSVFCSPLLHEQDGEIGYAYTSFKWGNNAKFNADVTVVVVSLRPISNAPKYFHEDIRTNVSQINGYLLDAPCVYVGPRSRPLSSELPK
ncbi:DNA methyltransferase [Actinomyces sp.]|uniref:DNA methyltransferase n=1 Tax=Actinomyces sp. TaxID=29317 RepID=UPI0037BF8C81